MNPLTMASWWILGGGTGGNERGIPDANRDFGAKTKGAMYGW